MTRGVFFGGRQRMKPGAYSVVDVSSATPISVGAQRILGFIGVAEGGKPGEILYFNDPQAAESVLRGGDLLKAMRIAWSPSPTLPGADLIAAIRVNPATQASYELADSGSTSVIRIESRDYGAWTNDIQVKLEAGTTAGTHKVTVRYGQTTESVDNLATNDDIVEALNALPSQLVVASKLGDTAPEPVDYTNLGGGGEGTPQVTDWVNALSKFYTKRVHGIVPVTADETIHAAVLEHCNMASVNQRARRAFFGHGLGEAKEDILERAKNLASQRAVLVTPGMKRGGELLPAYFTAAAVAGMWAGAERTEPLTLDLISCQGLETLWSDETNDFADFINGGVTAIQDVDGIGYQIVHAITTHLADDNTNLVELFKASLADEIDAAIREDLNQTFAGRGMVQGMDVSVRNRTISLLNNIERTQGWIVAGTDPNTGEEMPAYRNVQVVKQGTAFYVTYEASIIDPCNFILITSRFPAS